jgi:hypothetical protein
MLSAATGPTGFDVELGQDVIVSAVSVRREQLANSNCKRQHCRLPGCGLRSVRAQGARVARGRKHTRSTETVPRVPVQIQRLVEAPTPWRQRPPIALNSDTHVSERLATNFADQGSIPCGSTENAGRPASEDLSTSESPAALGGCAGQPASIFTRRAA